jgi:hypothetical protein
MRCYILLRVIYIYVCLYIYICVCYSMLLIVTVYKLHVIYYSRVCVGNLHVDVFSEDNITIPKLDFVHWQLENLEMRELSPMSLVVRISSRKNVQPSLQSGIIN